MSVDITITPPLGFPDPKESISSFARCPGNIMMATEEIGHERLDRIKYPEESKKALIDVIAEIDKGNDGKFNDGWCEEADRRWSDGKEAEESWRTYGSPLLSWGGPVPWKNKKQYWGVTVRDRLRKEAVRFLLYYTAGYQIEWSY
jgi:hypothetical protein